MANFKDAFSSARAAGKSTFKFNGRMYHTKTKEEMEKVKSKAAVPVPADKPRTDTQPETAKPSTPAPDVSSRYNQVGRDQAAVKPDNQPAEKRESADLPSTAAPSRWQRMFDKDYRATQSTSSIRKALRRKA